MTDHFAGGLARSFIQSISPPPEVQKMIDERAGMSAIGDLDDFFKFKAARAMETAAGKAGTGGGEGTSAMAMGMGAGLGMMIPGMLHDSLRKGLVDTKEVKEKGTIRCPQCHAGVDPTARFCRHCGEHLVAASRCPKCAKDLPVDAKFCMYCGVELGTPTHCPHCSTQLPEGARFCVRCGEKV